MRKILFLLSSLLKPYFRKASDHFLTDLVFLPHGIAAIIDVSRSREQFVFETDTIRTGFEVRDSGIRHS